MSHRNEDLVDTILREVLKLAPQLHPHALLEIEARLRKRFGGQRVYLRKGGTHAWLRGAKSPWLGRREQYVPSTTATRRK